MVYRRRLRFHYLGRPKIRADMKKENLFKLATLKHQITKGRTYFQQKWTAKATTRAYHGETIREKQWQRIFSRVSSAVVPMDHKYLAENDGSEHARGRGSGLLGAPHLRAERRQHMPYMNMTYHVAERRLDQAVFRALFASSTRQARQFCVHGHVRVNGKEMRFPGYMLNPGDMFQVDHDMVMYGIGALKRWAGSPQAKGEKQTPRRTIFLRRLGVLPSTDTKTNKGTAESAELEAGSTGEMDGASEDAGKDIDTLLDEEVTAFSELELDAEPDAEPESADDALKATRKTLRDLHASTRTLLTNAKTKRTLSSKQKQALRSFSRELRASMSRAKTLGAAGLEELQLTHATLTQNLLDTPESSLTIPQPPTAQTTQGYMYISASQTPHLHDPSDPDNVKISALPQAVQEKIRAFDENPNTGTRTPYPQPWRPRPFLAPFAFIPRYLEVNQNICSAVYLRHPVVRPGLAEVPTPFSPETLQLAFNWYLRRR